MKNFSFSCSRATLSLATFLLLNASLFGQEQIEADNILPKNEEALNEKWKWVRPVEFCHDFEKGFLRIKSLPGDIWGGGSTPTQNLLHTELTEENVCLTLKVSFNPTVHGEQAGLVLYLDDEHYCKVV